MEANEKKLVAVLAVLAFTVLLTRVFLVTGFNDKAIFTVTHERVTGLIWPNHDLPKGIFNAWVLGSHELETEYGEIRLENFARIEATGDFIWRIDFGKKRASHSLVVDGIEIPQNSAVFLSRGRPGRIEIFEQQVAVSGITLIVTEIYVNEPRYDADIRIVFLNSEYVTLKDGTEIHFVMSPFTGQPFGRRLNIYLDDKRWEISGQTAVKLPGETEFTMYRSITFEPDWGAFISGELLEE